MKKIFTRIAAPLKKNLVVVWLGNWSLPAAADIRRGAVPTLGMRKDGHPRSPGCPSVTSNDTAIDSEPVSGAALEPWY